MLDAPAHRNKEVRPSMPERENIEGAGLLRTRQGLHDECADQLRTVSQSFVPISISTCSNYTKRGRMPHDKCAVLRIDGLKARFHAVKHRFSVTCMCMYIVVVVLNRGSSKWEMGSQTCINGAHIQHMAQGEESKTRCEQLLFVRLTTELHLFASVGLDEVIECFGMYFFPLRPFCTTVRRFWRQIVAMYGMHIASKRR
jgi:hypothetical protein